MTYSKYPAALLRQQQSKLPASNTTGRKPLEEIPPPLKIQVFELLRQNGFAFDEALGLAGEVISRFTASPRQRVFAFGPVSFEITRELKTRLISTVIGHETLDRAAARL